MHPNSHAYRQNISTTTAIMKLMDTIYMATDDNLMTSLLALDQSAAFDCVNHGTLLRKLQKYGCCQDTLDWISSYLTGRSQYISVGSKKSQYMTLNRGVPQGSILGPLLYLVYINELAEVVVDPNCLNIVHSNKSRLFSEDCTAVWFSSSLC